MPDIAEKIAAAIMNRVERDGALHLSSIADEIRREMAVKKVATRALANSDATKYDLQRGLDAKGVTGYTSVGIGTASLAGMIRGKQNPAKSDDNQFGWIRETVNYYNDHLAKQQQLNANPLTSGKSQTTT